MNESLCYLCIRIYVLAHGVIGNTAVFGAVVQGSSPCGPTKKSFKLLLRGFFAFMDILTLKKCQNILLDHRVNLGSSPKVVGF